MKDYTIIETDSPIETRKMVLIMQREGWEVLGAPFVHGWFRGTFYQAMTKQEPIEKPQVSIPKSNYKNS